MKHRNKKHFATTLRSNFMQLVKSKIQNTWCFKCPIMITLCLSKRNIIYHHWHLPDPPFIPVWTSMMDPVVIFCSTSNMLLLIFFCCHMRSCWLRGIPIFFFNNRMLTSFGKVGQSGTEVLCTISWMGWICSWKHILTKWKLHYLYPCRHTVCILTWIVYDHDN